MKPDKAQFLKDADDLSSGGKLDLHQAESIINDAWGAAYETGRKDAARELGSAAPKIEPGTIECKYCHEIHRDRRLACPEMNSATKGLADPSPSDTGEKGR